MTKENSITEIKLMLKKLLVFSKEIKMGTLVLSDGSNISISSEDLVKDAEVYQMDDLGNQTPCIDGEYVLQDGRTFTVVEGKVDEVKEVVETNDTVTTVPETMEDMPEVEVEVEKPEGETEGDLATEVADLKKKLDEVLSILNQMGTTQNDLNSQMMAKIKRIGSEAGDDPVKVGKKGYTEYSDKTKEKKYDNFIELKEMMAERKKINNL